MKWPSWTKKVCFEHHDILVVAALCALLGGCAGGAIDYMTKEYGLTTPSDGSVDMSESTDYSVMYKIWISKTKPKILVQTSVGTASSVGLARGIGMDAAPIQPTFEAAAVKYLRENRSPDCRVSAPVRIADVAWEFDYDCAAQPALPKRSRR